MTASRKWTNAVVMGAVALGAAAIGAWARGRERVPDLPPAVLPSGERLSVLRSPAGKTPPSGAFDLLERLDLGSDTVSGSWGFQGASLFTSSTPWGRLQIPCSPPEEYDLKLVATRKHGIDSLDIGFVMGERQGVLRVDGNESQAMWIDLGTTRDLSSNPTVVPGKRLRWNRPTTIVLSVRKDRILVSVDGVAQIEWVGPPSALRLPAEFRTPRRSNLFIGSSNSLFRLDELLLTPVTGTPHFDR